MEKEFIPYEQALELKELGFDEPCFGFYTEEYKSLIKNFCKYPINLPTKPFLAPTFSQAFRFFREKYQMVFCYEPCIKKDLTYFFFIYIETTGENVFVVESKYDEEAEIACLNKLIEIVKGGNNG